MNKGGIKNVIIFDGEKEYTKSEIELNSTLKGIVNSVVTLGGFASIVELINEENATLYITSDLAHGSGNGKLINASDKLMQKYLLRKP